MIAVYAMGGGLGHVARARRLMARLVEGPAQCAIFTASPLAQGPDIVRVPGELSKSAAGFGGWLKHTLRTLAPEAIIVDAFPLGILGELADHEVLPKVPTYHVARLLQWDAYRSAFAGTPRTYDASYFVEPLTTAHEAFLRKHSRSVQTLALESDTCAASEDPFVNDAHPVWLVVHSGPASEVEALLDFAQDRAAFAGISPRYFVISPRPPELPDGAEHLPHARPAELYAHADRIITACGFNTMLETRPWRAKHLFLPFERRFDDQALRAARAASERELLQQVALVPRKDHGVERIEPDFLPARRELAA